MQEGVMTDFTKLIGANDNRCPLDWAVISTWLVAIAACGCIWFAVVGIFL
jgi:hypothetical protein